ncbi:MAG: nitroreductase, partial [Bacteroidota bacterium]
NEVIRKRKSVYPMQFIDKDISKEVLNELLLNANHAPTHRLTEPWRFKIFTGEGKVNLGKFMAEKYKATAKEPMDAKIQKIQQNASKSGAVLAIILHRDEEERVPEWEELAAVSMAVQNIWLALDQYDLGGYWSSPPLADYLREHVKMQENERCIGFFYLGYYKQFQSRMVKKPIENKIEWINS